MEKREQLYEGKAKKVYATDDPDLVIVSYKDDATAFNGLKKGTIKGKGVINNQMSVLNDWFMSNFAGYAKPVFLCGDFNVLPDSEVIALAHERWTLLSGEDLTYSTKKRSKCIDYIFAFKDAAPVEVQSAEVLVEGTENLSDHYPVLITVKY